VSTDTALGHLQQWRQSPLEQLRHTLTEANLARHLGTEPQRILDVAGGNGMAAVRLATQGHEVTVLDPAGAMLSTAIQAAEAHGVADRLHVVQAAAQDAPEVFAEHEFDLVLCHNLLHYAESPEERQSVLRAITVPLRGGGLLSVVGPNDAFVPVQAAVRDLAPDLALRELEGVASAWSTRCSPRSASTRSSGTASGASATSSPTRRPTTPGSSPTSSGSSWRCRTGCRTC